MRRWKNWSGELGEVDRMFRSGLDEQRANDTTGVIVIWFEICLDFKGIES
jgi:hypothetical protein